MSRVDLGGVVVKFERQRHWATAEGDLLFGDYLRGCVGARDILQLNG